MRQAIEDAGASVRFLPAYSPDLNPIWLRDPEEYNLPQYAMDMTALIARLGVGTVDWIGTSPGGLVGMVVAGAP